MGAVQLEPFPERVKRLARENGLSVSKVSYMAYDPETRGTNPETFKSVMAGRRAVTRSLVEAVARVLQVQPDEFPEYRLLMARRMLDEREVGLDAAVGALSQLDAALNQSAQAAASLAERPAAAKSRRTSAGRSAPKKSRGA